MSTTTLSLTERREVLRGLFSLAYVLLPVALAVLSALPELRAAPHLNLGTQLMRMLIFGAILEGVFLAIVGVVYAMAAVPGSPRPAWPLRPDLAVSGVRSVCLDGRKIALRVGFGVFRFTRSWPVAECQGLELASRPEGVVVGSSRRRFTLTLLLNERARVKLAHSLNEELVRRTAHLLHEATELPLEDDTYSAVLSAVPPSTEMAPESGEAGVAGFECSDLEGDTRVALWRRTHELRAGVLLTGVLFGFYLLAGAFGATGWLSEPTWVDVVGCVLLASVLALGIIRPLLVHRLVLQEGRLTYSLAFLGVPVKRGSMALDEIESVHLGFQEAALDTLSPEVQASVQTAGSSTILDGLAERRLLILGHSRSIDVRGLTGSAARAFAKTLSDWRA